MKITVFTSNQPRHIALINSLAMVGDVFAVQECTTVFPGVVHDLYAASPVKHRYFSRVIAAEKNVFGDGQFTRPNVRTMSLRMEDLSKLELRVLSEALSADLFIVFGASWIKGALADALVERNAINIHMGVSPYYRGSSCNFWAIYDGNADLVGATIHLLSKGLDSGDMLFHALPPRAAADPFDLGMLAVKAAHQGLIENMRNGTLKSIQGVRQNRSDEIRYTRNADFTDEVAAAYLARALTPKAVEEMMQKAPPRFLLNPFLANAPTP